jgi:hypothetical protein
VYIYEVTKSLGFSFGKKEKENQKLQLRAQTETKSFLDSTLRLAQTLAVI